jgi:2,3-bisphosphoglycerate-dependent phosphoglycerate mutase
MIRHAQSQWNRVGRFTGWADPPLTDAGHGEAVAAGRLLGAQGYRFDRAYCSAVSYTHLTLPTTPYV